MSDAPNVELMSALASLLDCGKYSDLTIACGMRRYSVHRAIVCPRSEFFDGAVRNPFREAETGVIDLTEDDPEAVEHMVNYFYHLDYLTKSISRRSSRRSSRPDSPLSPRRLSRRTPKKPSRVVVEDPLVAIASATTAASGPLTPPADQPRDFNGAMDDSSKLPDSPMAEQFEEDPFDAVQWQPEADVEKPNLVTHAKVYAIAEKYGISGLKALARTKFAQSAELHLDSLEFPDACQEAYESTVDADRGLRNVVVQCFRANPELSLRKDVEMMLRDTPSLSFELFRMASGLPVCSA